MSAKHDKNPFLKLGLLPHQAQHFREIRAMFKNGEIPLCPLRWMAIEQFDMYTAGGWKLDLIRGVFIPPFQRGVIRLSAPLTVAWTTPEDGGVIQL